MDAISERLHHTDGRPLELDDRFRDDQSEESKEATNPLIKDKGMAVSREKHPRISEETFQNDLNENNIVVMIETPKERIQGNSSNSRV